MNPVDFVHKRIRVLSGYIPGEQRNESDIIKLNTNENPFPISKKIREALIHEIADESLQKYPDPAAKKLRALIAEKYGRDSSYVLAGNGSDEILSLIFRSILNEGDRLIYSDPSYSLYPVLGAISGVNRVVVPVKNNWYQDFKGLGNSISVGNNREKSDHAGLTVITNPNTPTGIAESKADILKFAAVNPGLTLIDEAYIEFGGESIGYEAGSSELPRLMCCSTFSKAYSLAGERIGWLIAHPSLIIELDKVRDSYNLSRLAQVAAMAALKDEVEIKKNIDIIKENRSWLLAELKDLGFIVLPSSANFIFVSPPAREGDDLEISTAESFFNFLGNSNILVRYFNDGRLKEFVRITIGSKKELKKLLEVTGRYLT